MVEPSARTRWRLSAATAIIATAVLIPARPALAHVDLVESTPSDGSVATQPVETVVLTFSTAATLANDGVVVYDGTARPVTAEVTVLSDTEVVVTPSQPLGDGRWAVTWSMQAPDAHPTTGGFEFTVRAPAPGVDTEPGNPTPAVTATPPVLEAGGQSILAEVLPTRPWLSAWMATIARLLSLGGALFGIGSLVFALTVFEGSRGEARLIGFWIRRAGVAVALSVPLEVIAGSYGLAGGGLGFLAPGNLAAAAGGPLAFALTFRLIGGIAIVAGTRLVVVTGLPAPPTPSGPGVALMTRERLHVAASPAALVGAGIVAVSFLFDGHTVTASPAALVRFASLVHVVGGAVWVAGVALLARLLLARHARGEAVDTARLVIPFSTVAGVSVAMIGIAGGVLALSIADGFGTFFTTAWGRALIAKMVVAGIAGAIGGYNHLYVVPALRSDPEGRLATDAIRRTIGFEVGLLLTVVVVTAYFVGLSAVA